MLFKSGPKPSVEPQRPPEAPVPEPPPEPAPAPPPDPDAERRWQERATEERVREAIDSRRFHLNYQPIVSVAGGEIVGVEALLRLSSDVGRVRPELFLPILEVAGRWSEVGAWVLEHACAECRQWSVPDVWLTVNVSPQELHPGYADQVLRILERTGCPGESLCLELTTTVGLEDPAAAWLELRRLKRQGVRLLIDDFGTAGSSIADLAQFRLDAVKIAPTFVAGLGLQPEQEAIVGALVGLAHALEMDAIAEGVETPLQLARLQALGCDLAQGFHFHRPVDAASVGALFAAGASSPIP